MTTPEPLTAADLLEGEYGLTAATLGLDEVTFARRVSLWERIAGQRVQATAEQQAAHVAHLAISAQIAFLIGEDDKFRAEGDITVEKDIMARVKYLEGLLPGLRQDAGLEASEGGGQSSNPAPFLEPVGYSR